MDTDEAYIRDAIELAHNAASNGNTPFGSLLVVNDTVVKRSQNTTVTGDDITAHPELKLARWAAREFDRDQRASCTMYTSTEPCEMCATAIYYAELDRVVYSVSGGSLASIRENAESGIACADVIRRNGGSTKVDGPVLEHEGIRVHRAFYE